MHKCRQFLEGLPSFELVTDHKPLIPILNNYALDKLDNPRLLRLRLKIQRYAFTARWIPGKENRDSDVLSRAPIAAATSQDELAEGASFVSPRITMLCAIDGSDPTVIDPVLEKVKAAAVTDPVMKELRERVRHHLAVDGEDGMIVMGARVVIPKALQGDLLRDLLKMHQGTTKLRQRARLSVFWPNMDAEIVNLAGACEECTSSLPSHPPEPLRPHEPASRPFEQIHADLCQLNGRHFLIQVDAFSGWPHVVYFPDAHISAKKVINAVRELFINVGVPVKYWNGESHSECRLLIFPSLTASRKPE
ncbi:uncharacterized protein LOC123466779 [Daphnia magna]|uniref:uncharacterized protein LOC123466779 n=1 Tax=Daphnia magna TaxID=35525 RepID=UPI001E1BCD29|nr:uncharacterized protein LOC123466779 [Daphnia magna]